MEKKFDITAMGELLIDFAPAGKSDTGMKLFEQNPGGAPANMLAAAKMVGLNVASTSSGNSQAGPGSSKNTTSAAASSSASTTAAASNTGSKKPSHAYKMNFEGTYIFKSSKQLDESKTPLRLESGKKTMVVSAGEDGALSVNYPTAGTSLKLISTGNNTFKVENDDSTVFRFVGAGVYVTKSNNMEFGYAKR